MAENLRNGFNDPIRVERMKKVVEERKVNYLARLKFLLCEYGYMLRNRNFHAAKAYPLFVIAEDAETQKEKILTKIILLTVKDVLTSNLI